MGCMQGFSVVGKGAVLANFPTLAEWKKISSVGSPSSPPFRRDDSGLLRIDTLVESYNKAKSKSAGEQQYLLGELFVACTRWLNNMKFDKKMEEKRREAIMSLSFTATKDLAAAFECPPGDVAPRLINMFGKTMDSSGFSKDAPKAASIYLDYATRQQWRVIFRNGRAYRFSSTRDPKAPLNLLDTKLYEDQMEKNRWSEDRSGAGYVLSTGDELYVAPMSGKSGTGIAERDGLPVFHSGFMGSAPVQCAGMIKIEHGIVKRIFNNSGHYQPVNTALVRLLRLFESVGMNPKTIEVIPMNSTVSFSGDVFLKENGNWETIRKTACQSLYDQYQKATNKNEALRELVTERFDSLMNAYGKDHRGEYRAKNESPEKKLLREERERRIRLQSIGGFVEQPAKEIQSEQEIWRTAYRGVCWDLALFEPAMNARANLPPIPRQSPPRKAPPIPSSRPK